MLGKRKDPNAVALGSKGGKARARNLTPEQLHEIAMKGVEARKKALAKLKMKRKKKRK